MRRYAGAHPVVPLHLDLAGAARQGQGLRDGMALPQVRLLFR